ncbi:DNA-binding protein [Streptomyces sp. NPDC048603]|uniref:DNA-binding protein n=1 Tax=Streptomyces sp. NPDC048603 TaxID=3365577 RepID=UPI00371DB10E
MVTGPTPPTPPPLSAPDLMRVTGHLLALDAGPGATTAVRAAREAVRNVPELTTDPAYPRGADTDRTAALAELCEVIGWILFDAGLHRQAARANARALALAELCGDHRTARLVLLNHSMLQTHTGHARAALRSAARVVTPRTPHRVGTLVLIRRAHATAVLGGHAEPLDLIARARARFEDGISRHDPAWAWWIDEAELTGHEGWVHARLRRWDRAVPLLHEAATAPGPAYRHLFTAELLSALARAGAWTETADLIADIAPRVTGIGSVRTLETLGRTAAGLRRHPRTPAPLRDAAVHLLESLPAPAARTAASAPHDR